MKKHILLGLFTFLLVVLSSRVTYAIEPFFTSLGVVQGYKIPDSKQNTLLLSRDGSYATPIQSGALITKPGIYYLSEVTDGQVRHIRKFQIPVSIAQSEWMIDSPNALQEILKYSLEHYKEKITIQFTKGTYSIHDMNQLISSLLEELMETYPKVNYVKYNLTQYGTQSPKIILEFHYALEQVSLLKTYNQNLDKQVEELIKTLIKPHMKDYERERVIGEYLMNHLVYATRETDLSHTMQGALVEGIAVCDGYAKSYMYLLNSIGIPTKFVTGTATSENQAIPHAWNLVKLQDGYYHVDLTWADSEGGQIGHLYPYFNETDDYMKLTHTWEQDQFPKAEGKNYLSIYLPIEQQGVYKVSSKKEWEKVSRQLGKDGLEEANLIFYELSTNKWSTEKILDSILKEEKQNISYSIYYKYDSMVVNYRIH